MGSFGPPLHVLNILLEMAYTTGSFSVGHRYNDSTELHAHLILQVDIQYQSQLHTADLVVAS